MCGNCGCTKPEEKKPCEAGEVKPGECTPEQIAECHPESKGHPCEGTKQDDCTNPSELRT